MIGEKVFEIDQADIIKGMSSSDHITDGGFSPLSEGVNLTKSPGLIYFSAEKVDQTDDLTDDLIASCEDGTLGTAAVDRIFVDDAGNYYDWDGHYMCSRTFKGKYTMVLMRHYRCTTFK